MVILFFFKFFYELVIVFMKLAEARIRIDLEIVSTLDFYANIFLLDSVSNQ